MKIKKILLFIILSSCLRTLIGAENITGTFYQFSFDGPIKIVFHNSTLEINIPKSYRGDAKILYTREKRYFRKEIITMFVMLEKKAGGKFTN